MGLKPGWFFVTKWLNRDTNKTMYWYKVGGLSRNFNFSTIFCYNAISSDFVMVPSMAYTNVLILGWFDSSNLLAIKRAQSPMLWYFDLGTFTIPTYLSV